MKFKSSCCVVFCLFRCFGILTQFSIAGKGSYNSCTGQRERNLWEEEPRDEELFLFCEIFLSCWDSEPSWRDAIYSSLATGTAESCLELSMNLSFSALCVICCIDFRQFNCQVYANAMQEEANTLCPPGSSHSVTKCVQFIRFHPILLLWLVMATGTQ